MGIAGESSGCNASAPSRLGRACGALGSAAAWVSALVLVAIVVVAFIHRRGRRTSYTYYGPRHCYIVDAQPLRLTLAITTYDGAAGSSLSGSPGQGGTWSSKEYSVHQEFASAAGERFGLAFSKWNDHGYGGPTRSVSARYPWIIAAAAIPPGLMIRAWRRRRRCGQTGCCKRCGYDLRATPGRCPECGTPADAPRRIVDEAKRPPATAAPPAAAPGATPPAIAEVSDPA